MKDDNMWVALIPIIAQYGIEFAYRLWANSQQNTDPTEQQWAALQTLANKSYDDYINEARRRAGLPVVVTTHS